MLTQPAPTKRKFLSLPPPPQKIRMYVKTKNGSKMGAGQKAIDFNVVLDWFEELKCKVPVE